MLEQFITSTLTVTGFIHVLYKWKIKIPFGCDFCFSFWASCIFWALRYNESFVQSIFNIIAYSLSGATLSFYISLRINMYENNKPR